ncbi:MAG TPA: PEP-CTERM sorting domain-containing protein [Caldimonas sp.]
MRLVTQSRGLVGRLFGVAVAAGCALTAIEAKADLTLNAAGIADGFSLSTFYRDPAATYGLVGSVGIGGSTVIGSGYARNQIYKFNDVDGQSFGTALLTVAAGGTPTDVATAAGVAYVGLLGGHYYSINPTTLALTVVPVSNAITATYGLWGNQTNGHLIAGTNQGLVDINPLTGAFTVVGNPGGNIDGVTVSPDGTVAYIETNSNAIFGYSLISPSPSTPVFSRTGLAGGPDGTGIISGGLFDGYIVVNNNDGTVGLINHVTGVETVIASGGTRGDLVAPDTNNGTLFLANADQTYRLSCGPNCAIGSVPTVPEPETYALMMAGLAAIGWVGRRRRKQ